jgi:single-strand DNA-binding protein
MFETTMTVVGNVVSDPRTRRTDKGVWVSNFRVASTSRRYDAALGRFVDGDTLFLNVTCWRALAENVEASVHKGNPVIVTGRIRMREYEKDEAKRLSYDLEATSVGLDLARGTAEFRKAQRPGASLSMAVDGDGLPADDSDRWLGLAGAAAGGLAGASPSGGGTGAALREPALAG